MTEQIKFLNQYDPPEISPDPVYPTKVETFNQFVLPDGTVKRTPAEPYDLNAEIQSYEKDCNLHAIWDRYRIGDPVASTSRPGMYLDLSGCPNDEFAAAEFFEGVAKVLRSKISENGKKSADQSGDQSGAAADGVSENGKEGIEA